MSRNGYGAEIEGNSVIEVLMGPRLPLLADKAAHGQSMRVGKKLLEDLVQNLRWW